MLSLKVGSSSTRWQDSSAGSSLISGVVTALASLTATVDHSRCHSTTQHRHRGAPMDRDPAFDLTGQVAVITGGASGIGLGFAHGLARAGASVAILGRTPERLEKAAEELTGHGGTVLPLACDVSEESTVVKTMQRIVDELGRIDACFANAAVDGPFAGTLETSLADFRAVTAVNLDGAFVAMREAARHMVAVGKGGSLVATSSV